jgi:ribosome maturation factor RimP
MEKMFNQEEIIERLKKLVLPVIEDSGAYLVDINLRGVGRKQTVEIFVDTDDGITIDECVRISKAISEILDSYDIIPGSYQLEVSSPGVGNPFKVRRQYRTNIGRFLRVKFLKSMSDEVEEVSGKLLEADESGIKIRGEDGRMIELRYEQIVEARTEIIW